MSGDPDPSLYGPSSRGHVEVQFDTTPVSICPLHSLKFPCPVCVTKCQLDQPIALAFTQEVILPYGLTARQAQVVDMVTITGHYKVAADKLGIAPKTVEITMRTIRDKMKATSSIRACVLWDRWIRSYAKSTIWSSNDTQLP